MSRTIRNRDPRYCETTRDKKDWQKPPSIFKRLRRKVRKAKEKDAMKHILEDVEATEIPRFKKDDVWDWN